MRRAIAPILCVLFLLGGCRGTRVSVMGWEIDRPAVANSDLSREEKVGVIVVLCAAVAAGIVAAVALD